MRMFRIIRLSTVICVLTAFACAQQAETQGAQGLPKGVIKATAPDEKDFCHQWVGSYGRGCNNEFQKNLWWRQLAITPSGEIAILIESRNMGYCGSAGCSLYLFKQASGTTLTQVLGRGRIGDVGTLARVKVLEASTKGYYDLQKTWADEETVTVYKWDGSRYLPVDTK